MNGIKKTSSNIWYALIVFSLFLFLRAGAIAQTEPQDRNVNNDAVVVNVWAASPDSTETGEAPGPPLSKGFILAGLNAMSAFRSWQSHLSYMIRNGYPLAEQWLIEDRDSASDRLQLAAQAASTSADRAALADLQNQYRNLQEWSDYI